MCQKHHWDSVTLLYKWDRETGVIFLIKVWVSIGRIFILLVSWQQVQLQHWPWRIRFVDNKCHHLASPGRCFF